MNAKIHKNGVHITKMAKSVARTKVVPVPFFLPKHDFSNDLKYAQLCEPLTHREIEIAKMASIPGTKQVECVSVVMPDITKISCYSTWARIVRKPGFGELVEYLRTLCFKYDFAGKIDDERLMAMAEESIQSLGPGAQKFNAAMKLLEYRERRAAKKKGGKENTDPASEDKYDEALIEIERMTEPANDNSDS